jgi:hypothetical protein
VIHAGGHWPFGVRQKNDKGFKKLLFFGVFILRVSIHTIASDRRPRPLQAMPSLERVGGAFSPVVTMTLSLQRSTTHVSGFTRQ